MALTPEQQARLAELEAKFGNKEREPNALEKAAPFTTGLVRGAVKKGAATTTVPLIRALAKAGLPWAQKEIEKVEAYNQTEKGAGEKLGGLVGDFAMLAPAAKVGQVAANAPKMAKFLAGLTRGGAAGAQGAVQHQAQEYGATGEIDPGEAAGEFALTTGTMGVGNAIPAGVKNTAAGYLQLLTRAPKRLERGMNPPTHAGFKQALEEKIFPILKGGYKTAEKRGIAKQIARDAEKLGILNAAGIRGNADEVLKEAESAMRGRAAGSSGLLPGQMTTGTRQLRKEYGKAWKNPSLGADVNKTIESGAHQIASRTNPAYGDISAEGLLDLRKMADANANWVEGKTPAGLDLASQEFRRAAEKQLAGKMAGKTGEAKYGKLKKEMADLAPVLEAFNEKAISNYSIGPELATGLIGSLAGNPWIGAIPALRRVPQVAPAFYELGRGAGSQTARKGGKAILDLGRASYYGGEE